MGSIAHIATALLMIGSTSCLPPTERPKNAEPTMANAPSAGSKASPTLESQRKSKAPNLFPRRPTGWAAVDRKTIPQIQAFATDYAAYLGASKTPRRAVARLIARFAPKANQLSPGARPKRTPGQRYWLRGRGGDAAAFVVLGKRPIEDGVRIVIAAIDAPRIDLEQRPVAERAGLTMLDTQIYGDITLESWLSQPLALYVYASGARDTPLDLAIGDADGDPILVIPDLLPHLARKVQRKRIVDGPKRMHAVAARRRRALTDVLTSRGADETVLAEAEASLVPAGAPVFVGVDRALLSGYGHSHRGVAYAAVRALETAGAPEFTAVVVAVSRSHARGEGTSGLGFVHTALSQLLRSLSTAGSELDALATRRFYTRSAALVTADLRGDLNRGLILSPRSDDALPRATRRVLDRLIAAGVQYQMSEKRTKTPARTLSTLDLDVVAMAIPITGRGNPREILSILDLHQAYKACIGWFTRP